MSPLVLYLLVILAYLPGLLALFIWRRCWRFPILLAAFAGMFLFSAVGSISVFLDEKIYRLAFDTSKVRDEFALLLVYQALALYLVAGLYIGLRKPPEIRLQATRIDILFCVLIACCIILTMGFYFFETGTFLLLASLDGSMNNDNAFAFRMKYVYGLKYWPLYNLGFVFLPILLAGYGLILAMNHKRFRSFFLAATIISFAASVSLGSKAGVINFVLIFGMAYVAYSGMTGTSIWSVTKNRFFWVLR